MKPRIAVIDHGAGNLVSIAQGLERAGGEVTVAGSPDELALVDGMVLPGVGATAAVMAGIDGAGFSDPLRWLGVPLLGICVGMQVLFESSDEDGAGCLGLLAGTVKRLTRAPRLPHIGWNDLDLVGSDPLLAGLGPAATFYFVHSFAPAPEDPAVVTATTLHGDRFVSAVRSGLVSGTQFHPERSGRDGLTILANFVSECAAVAA